MFCELDKNKNAWQFFIPVESWNKNNFLVSMWILIISLILFQECDGLDEDNLKLQEENKALIRAMSKLTANMWCDDTATGMYQHKD